MIQHEAVHPGEILREQMGDDITVTDLAIHLQVACTTLTRVLNGTFGVTVAMAMRLAQAFPTTNERFWMNLRASYELSKALKEGQPTILPVGLLRSSTGVADGWHRPISALPHG